MMEILPVAVRSTAGVVGIWGLLGVAVVTAIKAWPMLRKMQLEADGSLRTDLLARIAKQDAKIEAQEVAMAKEREDCLRSIQRLEAQIQLFRHERNNANARFQALLMLLKRNPDDVPGTIAMIEEMVRQQEQAIAAEKGAMAGATMNGSTYD